MIDLEKAKQYFKQYISNYDMNEPRIALKVAHMYHVAEDSRMIAKSLNLPEEEQDLAELIGLLHDIGRFDQWKFYETYSDKMSIDHGQKSVEVLFADKHMRSFVVDERYDSVIYKAINNHNKLEIEKGLSEREMLHAKIIRDSDNLDIFRSLLAHPLEEHTHMGSKDVSREILSPETFEDFKKEKIMLYAKAKSDMDIMVVIIAHIYAINFKETLKRIQENDYIRQFVKKIDAKNIETREKLEKIADYAMEYMDRKIKGETR